MSLACVLTYPSLLNHAGTTVWSSFRGSHELGASSIMLLRSLRLEPLVEIEYWGYRGSTTRRFTPSLSSWSTASSVKGYQYLIPRYILLSIPLPLSSSSSLVPCSIVSLTMGEPPPMDSYASRELGAREEAMRRAMKLWRGWRGPGRRMMSGSLKRLKRKSSTSSSDSGPPRLRKRMPTLSWAGAAAWGWAGASEGAALPMPLPKMLVKMLPSGGGLETAEERSDRGAGLGAEKRATEEGGGAFVAPRAAPGGAKASAGPITAERRPRAASDAAVVRIAGMRSAENANESEFAGAGQSRGCASVCGLGG
mmetsp:Transcript_12483/g.31361  ORF Transcript_12483/g.31361 Transcript_12483/m.31361 type:complete len:309 (+) Transcript_12483:1363-2289(+)